MKWNGPQDLRRWAARHGIGGSVSQTDNRLLADECNKSNEALQSETGVKSIINIRVFHRVLIRHAAAVWQMSASSSAGAALQALT